MYETRDWIYEKNKKIKKIFGSCTCQPYELISLSCDLLLRPPFFLISSSIIIHNQQTRYCGAYLSSPGLSQIHHSTGRLKSRLSRIHGSQKNSNYLDFAGVGSQLGVGICM